MKLLNRRKYIIKELKENRIINACIISIDGYTIYYDFKDKENSIEPNILKVITLNSPPSYDETINLIFSFWEKVIEKVHTLQNMKDDLNLKELPKEYNFRTPGYLLYYYKIPEEFIKEIKIKRLRKKLN